MLVQSNGSFPFSNPFASSPTSSASDKESLKTTQLEQITNDFNMVAQDLSPMERKLYNSLIYSENYQAAKGLVTIGFLRAAGMYQDTQGNPLPGHSLSQDLSRLNPPSTRQDQNALLALQHHLTIHPSSLTPDNEKRGNLLDLRI